MTTTTQKITDILTAAIEHERQSLHEAVLDVLRPFDGKKITKRLATAVAKALPQYTVHYDACSITSAYRIYIWGAGLDYDQRAGFYLGNADTRYPHGHECPVPGKVFAVKQFLDDNVCYYSAATNRNERRQKLLKNQKRIQRIATTIDAYRAAYVELFKATIDVPDEYEMRRLAGLDR